MTSQSIFDGVTNALHDRTIETQVRNERYIPLHISFLFAAIFTSGRGRKGRARNACLTRCAVNTGWREIDIHDCFPMRQLARATTIDGYGVTMSVPRVRVTSQIKLWWHHHAKSAKTVLSENGKKMAIDYRFSGLCALSVNKIASQRYHDRRVTMNTDFCHPWGSSVMFSTSYEFGNDFHDTNPVFTVPHTLFSIYFTDKIIRFHPLSSVRWYELTLSVRCA